MTHSRDIDDDEGLLGAGKSKSCARKVRGHHDIGSWTPLFILELTLHCLRANDLPLAIITNRGLPVTSLSRLA